MHRRTFLSATSVLAASVGLGGGEARANAPPARTLSVFNSVSLDGFFTDESNDMSWAHTQDPEWNKFMSTNASGEAELVFGRKTYEMMARF